NAGSSVEQTDGSVSAAVSSSLDDVVVRVRVSSTEHAVTRMKASSPSRYSFIGDLLEESLLSRHGRHAHMSLLGGQTSMHALHSDLWDATRVRTLSRGIRAGP